MTKQVTLPNNNTRLSNFLTPDTRGLLSDSARADPAFTGTTVPWASTNSFKAKAS